MSRIQGAGTPACLHHHRGRGKCRDDAVALQEAPPGGGGTRWNFTQDEAGFSHGPQQVIIPGGIQPINAAGKTSYLHSFKKRLGFPF